MEPSPLGVHGPVFNSWLVIPRRRIAFEWLGPSGWHGRDGSSWREHGAVQKSPPRQTLFWCSHAPAKLPVDGWILPLQGRRSGRE